MANFEGVTTCNDVKIIEGKETEVAELIEKYTFNGEMNVYVDKSGYFQLHGHEFLYIAKNESDDPTEHTDIDGVQEFLTELAPFLADTLVIQSIGNEKCRYPLVAQEIVVYPSGLIQYGGFQF